MIVYRKEYMRLYFIKNKDNICLKKRVWRRKNKDEVNRKRKIKYYERLKNSPWHRYYYYTQQRCNSPKCHIYKHYGGRGIKLLMMVKDFKYLWFRDKAYKMDCPSIDRIDNDGNYELSNCQFIELKENSGKNCHGEDSVCSKLKNKDVIEMRRLKVQTKITYKQLAKKYNVSKGLVWRIVKRKYWKHI